MHIHEINACRICNNNNLASVMDLGTHALSGRFPAKDEPDPPQAPLVLVKCDTTGKPDACGLLQLKHAVSADELYLHDYGYRSGLNMTMTNHLKSIVNEAEFKVPLSIGDTVLDIGSNDATLLKSYKTHGLKKIGIDPTGAQFKKYYTENISLLADYFTAENFDKVSKEKAKIITSIAMFYDLPDPLNFVRDIKQSLHKDGLWVFEQSYMPLMLSRNSFDTICHEHLEYYSFKQIEWMMNKAGMKIVDVSFNDINGGSFRTAVAHKDAKFFINRSVIELIRDHEKALGIDTLKPYEEFRKRIEDVRSKITRTLVEAKNKGKTVHIYGASTKGNTLLQYLGINTNLVQAAAERNTDKFGRRTPLTNIPIISEEESRKINPDYYFVLPWHFKDEFLEREKQYLDSGGSFIFPLPNFEIISNKDMNNTQ